MLGWLKRILLFILVAILSYALTFYVFTGFKIKGYTYLFRATQPYDLVIKHAAILDGTGLNDLFRGDIAIRDGKIVGVGYVNPKNSPVFDAGGLLLLPYPVKIEKSPEVVEHLLNTSYPRFPAEEIFLQEPPYQGLSLAEAARMRGVPPEEVFKFLKNTSPPTAKVYLVPFFYRENDYSAKEMLARLSGYRAQFLGEEKRGRIQAGCQADMYVYKILDYPEDRLNEFLQKGILPEPVNRIEKGKFLNQ